MISAAEFISFDSEQTEFGKPSEQTEFGKPSEQITSTTKSLNELRLGSVADGPERSELSERSIYVVSETEQLGNSLPRSECSEQLNVNNVAGMSAGEQSLVTEPVNESSNLKELKLEQILSAYSTSFDESIDLVRKHSVIEALYSKRAELKNEIRRLELEANQKQLELERKQEEFDETCCEVASLASTKKKLECVCERLNDECNCEFKRLRELQFASSCYDEAKNAQVSLNELREATANYEELITAKNLSDYYLHFKNELMLYKLSYEHLKDIEKRMNQEQQLQLAEIENMKARAEAEIYEMKKQEAIKLDGIKLASISRITVREQESKQAVEKRLAECEAEITRRQIEANEELANMRTKAIKEIDDLKAQHESEYEMRTKEIDDLKARELNSIEQVRQQANQEIDNKRIELKRLQEVSNKEIADLKTHQEIAYNNRIQELDEKENSLNERLANLEEREHQLQTNKDRIANYPKLKTDYNSLKRDFEAMKRDNERLRNENTKLSSAVETFITFKRK